MHINDLLIFLLSTQGFFLLLKSMFLFSVFLFCGSTIFYSFFQTKNKLLLLGAGMITGPMGFLLVESVLSYIFKGNMWILILGISYLAFCIGLFLRINIKEKIHLPRISFSNTFFGIVLIVYLITLTLFCFTTVVGGDVITYWSIATSFAHGNYPTVLPWQPNFLTVYHEGIFIIEGAIHAIGNIYISQVHFLFSAYILCGLFLFITGITGERIRSPLSILPAVMGIICFAGPVILVGNFSHFFNASFSEMLKNLTLFPQFGDIKNGYGGGTTSLSDLVYVNFRTFGLSAFFLFLYVFIQKQTILRKYILLAIITILTVSIDESFFLLEIPIILSGFIWELRRFHPKQIAIYSSIVFFTIVGLFWIVQNPIRDSLLTPSPDAPRFKLLSFTEPEFKARMHYMDAIFAPVDKAHNTIWYIPDLRFLILCIGLLALWKKNKWAILLTASAGVSIVFYLLVVNTFWYANAVRIILNAYELLFFALGFILLSSIHEKKKNVLCWIVIVVLFLLILPQLSTANARLFTSTFTKDYNNIIQSIQPNETLDWIYNHIGQRKRLFFLEKDFPSEGLSTQAVMQYGLIVPTADPTIKVLNIDSNGFWYDASVSLDPKALQQLGIDYVFIENSADKRLSLTKQQDVKDESYFIPVYQNFQGTLFHLQQAYFTQKNTDLTLSQLINKIASHSSIYLDTFNAIEIRKEFILSLAKRTTIYGYTFSIGSDYPMYIETASIPSRFIGVYTYEQIHSLTYDYLLLRPETNPQDISSGIYENIASMSAVILWKKTN